MQVEYADWTKIFRRKLVTFGGAPVFRFQSAGTEIVVLFAQNFHFQFVAFLRHHYANNNFGTENEVFRPMEKSFLTKRLC